MSQTTRAVVSDFGWFTSSTSPFQSPAERKFIHVLLRDGKITDDARIVEALPTIKHAVELAQRIGFRRRASAEHEGGELLPRELDMGRCRGR